MIIYLPITFIREWLCSLLKRCKNGKITETVDRSCGLDSPLKLSGMQKILELGSLSPLSKKDSEIDLSLHKEGKPFIIKLQDELEAEALKENKVLSTRKIAMYSFLSSPHLVYNRVLIKCCACTKKCGEYYSVVFNFRAFYPFHWRIFGPRFVKYTKVVAVFVSMAGVAMTTLGKTWAADGPLLSSSENGKPSLVGDLFGLLSAVTYGLFTVLLKMFSGEEGEKFDVSEVVWICWYIHTCSSLVAGFTFHCLALSAWTSILMLIKAVNVDEIIMQ